METKISVNLKDMTCSLEVSNLFLGRISNLSALPEMVAEQLKRNLYLISCNPESKEKIESSVSLLLEGKIDTEDILKSIF